MTDYFDYKIKMGERQYQLVSSDATPISYNISEELSNMATVHAEIPMRGIKQSLNVSVATGVAGYEFSRIYTSLRK